MENNTQERIIDLDISPIKKSKIRINGDQNDIIELNLSDMNIMKRLDTAYNNLKLLSKKVASIETSDDTEDEAALKKMTKKLDELDAKMRKEVDFIFDSAVSDKCVPSGTMYDPHDGEFTYEHVIESLLGLYATNMKDEFKKIKSKVAKHTNKYTNTKKR